MPKSMTRRGEKHGRGAWAAGEAALEATRAALVAASGHGAPEQIGQALGVMLEVATNTENDGRTRVYAAGKYADATLPRPAPVQNVRAQVLVSFTPEVQALIAEHKARGAKSIEVRATRDDGWKDSPKRLEGNHA